MARTWLFGASWCKFIKDLLLHEIAHVSLFFCFFLKEGTEIMNAQSGGKDWYLTSRNKCTDAKSFHVTFQIKSNFSQKLIFSEADIHMFLYESSNVYKWIKCILQAFGFTGNW